MDFKNCQIALRGVTFKVRKNIFSELLQNKMGHLVVKTVGAKHFGVQRPSRALSVKLIEIPSCLFKVTNIYSTV